MQNFSRYAEVYNLINQGKPYKKECEFILQWANLPLNILDVGCGTAKYWEHFPCEMVGIEKSQEMINQSPYSDRIINADIMSMTNSDEVDKFECATALFDVVNYIPSLAWIKKLPIKKGGLFIFDLWDLNKIDRDGFKDTKRIEGNCTREIVSLRTSRKKVTLIIKVTVGDKQFTEEHKMNLFSESDIFWAANKVFKIKEIKFTDTWQTWYLLQRI